MRAMLTFGSLLIVLAVIAVSVRTELRASKAMLPSAAASGASSPFVGTPQNQVTQYQHVLEQAMKADAQHTADQAASAADDGAR